ncbi:hypothetical protein TTHERM_01400690 (macronuclear) [Tetrahymena thermophila SB210]|uniref:Uncharacterized protein n=1 Tax=Tetrahymena thermophila (strain SB210) TaxID=312017 RepID=Q229I0_TETTS|nr:hypothetical protein TTHERM_01400690 [Tetrahymena thermophila SB210]EAR81945.1 hypothetical protein TTHERM_01400690 [Tetrahymena thermophila SB210]|eukprot:XP_001029608.1 hypothetical protein TTHERM_01400690 [Tetrahymena thermophila SB210]
MEIQGFSTPIFSQSSSELSNNIFVVPFEYSSPFGHHYQINNKKNNNDDEIYNDDDCYSKDEEDSKENEKQQKRMRRIKKKIQKDKGQINLKQFTIQSIPCRELFKLNSGVYITLDGVLRFCYSQNPVSFGFSPQKVLKIEEMHNLGIIDITQTIDNLFPKRSIEDCVNLMMHKNLAHLNKQVVFSELDNFDQMVRKIYNCNALPKQLRVFKENEFQSFIQHSYKYIGKLQNEEPDLLLSFVIGRYNYIDKDVEICHTGMSKGYLSLLGLDYNTFRSIVLRNQKVDLIQNKADIILSALNGINLKSKFNSEDTFSADIITFDGYPLKINYHTKNVTIQQKLNDLFGDEYILVITKINVSPNQMQGLVDYRKKLMLNSEALSIDEYINKELSYLFEDVEYSVQSQQFIEKYYKENLDNLLKQKGNIQCGYRYIQNESKISQIQIENIDLKNLM